MLATLGDLIDDIVVSLHTPIQVAADTPANITHRRGGSAANVAASAASLGHPSRFLGQVGDDPTADLLLGELGRRGVDVSKVTRSGTTGTIIVIVDTEGERTMLTDRRACIELSNPEPAWLDGVTCFHVPFYSLVAGPIADTARTLISWAHKRSIAVSVDISSTTVLTSIGVAHARELLDQLAPTVVFANEEEAKGLGIEGAIGSAITVVKRGAKPAQIFVGTNPVVEVPALPVASGSDSTGAGDAFAAGFLSDYDAAQSWRHDPLGACARAHQTAASLMQGRRA